MEMNPERFHFAKPLRKAAAEQSRLQRKKTSRVDVNLHPSSDEVRSMSKSSQKSLLEPTLPNAIKFSHDGGKVEIRADCTIQTVTLV